MRARDILTLVGFCALALGTTGCANRAQQDYAQLSSRYDEVQTQNAELRADLEATQQQQASLLAELDARNAELARTRMDAQAARQAPPSAQPAPQQPGVLDPRRGERIVLESDLLFPAGRATLTAAGQQKLTELASRIKSQYPNAVVLVYGYTDADPIRRTRNLWQDNLDLSANRAMAVSRALIERGISRERIETIAMGEAKPSAPNTSTANKARNRRVEVFVLRQ